MIMCKKNYLSSSLFFYKKNWCKKHRIKQCLQLLLATISIITPHANFNNLDLLLWIFFLQHF
jgi:hypothetical protein